MGRKWGFVGATALGVGFLFAVTRSGLADQIILQNGRSVSGDIIAQDANFVTVDLSNVDESITRKISRTQIKQINSWGHPSSQNPEFIVLPVQGVIGVDVTARALKAGISSAERLCPRYIVLFIDSDGGNIGELVQMVDAIHAVPRDIEVVAFVHKAYSAAAVLAMSCPKIYETPDAVIGAAVPLKELAGKLPEDLEAKFKSAIEAKQRTWVAAAGHDDLLLRGMMEMDLEIYLSDDEDGNPVLSTSRPGKLIKHENEILTLTADEAVECGLASEARDFPDVGQRLAHGVCTEASQRPWAAVIRVARHDKHVYITNQVKAQLAPEMNAIVDRANTLIARITADKDGMNRLASHPNSSTANDIELLRTDAESAILELNQLRDRFEDLKNKIPEYDDY